MRGAIMRHPGEIHSGTFGEFEEFFFRGWIIITPVMYEHETSGVIIIFNIRVADVDGVYDLYGGKRPPVSAGGEAGVRALTHHNNFIGCGLGWYTSCSRAVDNN